MFFIFLNNRLKSKVSWLSHFLYFPIYVCSLLLRQYSNSFPLFLKMLYLQTTVIACAHFLMAKPYGKNVNPSFLCNAIVIMYLQTIQRQSYQWIASTHLRCVLEHPNDLNSNTQHSITNENGEEQIVSKQTIFLF